MIYKSLSVLPLLTKHSFIDQWFPVSYSINFSNGCPLSCIYCPVNFEEEKIIIHKKKIFEELARECRNIPFGSFVGVGGGYTETFHEKKNVNTENLIQLLLNHKHQLLFLTQTCNFKNYIPLFKDKKNKPIIVITMNCLDEKTNSILSPDSPTIEEKISLIQICKKNNIPIGIFFSPIIHGINDNLETIQTILKLTQGANFFLFNFAEYKTLATMQKRILNLNQRKKIIYKENLFLHFEEEKKYQSYIQIQSKILMKQIQKYNHMPRIPLELLQKRLSIKELIIVLLTHIYFFLQYNGEIKKTFLFHANQLRKLSIEQFNDCIEKENFKQYFNISHFLQKTILEMVNGNFNYYHEILKRFFVTKNKD